MIIDVLKDGFKTVKEHKWAILGMWMPAFIVGVIANCFSNNNAITAAISNLSIDPVTALNTLQSSFALMFIFSILTSLFSVSLKMGLLKSDQDGNFNFKNAFAAFDGMTWVGVIVIDFLAALIEAVLIVLFAVVVLLFFFAGVNQQNSFFFAIAALVALIGIAVFIYVSLGLAFIFLTYYTDTKDTDLNNGFIKSFPETWKLMKGHRYELLGLIVLQFLISFGVFLAFLVVVVIVAVLFSLMHGSIIAISLATILGILIFIAAIVAIVFLDLWFLMSQIKFFERLK